MFIKYNLHFVDVVMKSSGLRGEEMDNSIKLVLVTGLITFASTAGGYFLQYIIDRLKKKDELRRYPAEVLFNKQTEFYDKVVNIFPEIYSYIMTIIQWLSETSTSQNAKLKAQEASKETNPIWKFKHLNDAYLIYLPEKILFSGNDLINEFISLSESLTGEKTLHCLDLFFSYQKTIRQCVGVDKISEDLLRAFGTHAREKEGKDSKE